MEKWILRGETFYYDAAADQMIIQVLAENAKDADNVEVMLFNELGIQIERTAETEEMFPQADVVAETDSYANELTFEITNGMAQFHNKAAWNFNESCQEIRKVLFGHKPDREQVC